MIITMGHTHTALKAKRKQKRRKNAILIKYNTKNVDHFRPEKCFCIKKKLE